MFIFSHLSKSPFPFTISVLQHYCTLAAQGGCGVSFSRDIQDPRGQGPVQPSVGDPASAGGLD